MSDYATLLINLVLSRSFPDRRGAVILCTRKRSYGTRIKVLVDLNKVTPAKWDQKKLEKYFVPAKEIWNKDAPKDGKGYGLNGSLRCMSLS